MLFDIFWPIFIICLAILIMLGVLWAACYQPPQSNEAELDAFQGDTWRLDGYSEEDIKAMCSSFNILYSPPKA